MVNGVEVDLTPEEEADYNARQAAWDAAAPSRMIEQFTDALEVEIDTVAAQRSYSSGVSCASYKDSTSTQWAAEATVFIAWRDSCYVYAYDYLAKAQDGTIPSPTIDDFIAGLPAINWPTQPQE